MSRKLFTNYWPYEYIPTLQICFLSCISQFWSEDVVLYISRGLPAITDHRRAGRLSKFAFRPSSAIKNFLANIVLARRFTFPPAHHSSVWQYERYKFRILVSWTQQRRNCRTAERKSHSLMGLAAGRGRESASLASQLVYGCRELRSIRGYHLRRDLQTIR